ncbi:MAG: hypothetical protein JWO68_1865 [Actinomycetia bacterium]|nr:hypothetical protein [Actinomycetes bacterium]
MVAVSVLSLGPVDELLRLLDDARADERGASRERERFLRQAAEEGARLAGTLVDLAERASTVTVRMESGRAHHGPVRLVGADFCVLATEAGDVWLALRGVSTIRPHAGERHAPATGDRPAIDLLLVEALARAAPERPRLALVTAGGESLAGELRAVGEDVLTLRLDGDPRGVCYVSTSAIREVLRSG